MLSTRSNASGRAGTPAAAVHRIGDHRLHIVSDGTFRLDGGAMFGVVPKPLWEKKKPADERNRIVMGTNCLLVESGDELLLVDCGVGEKLDAKAQGIFGLDPEATRLPAAIRAAGFALEDITHVLLSHLHFDHCGWSTRRVGGGWQPTFPKARYWMCRGELEHARDPLSRDHSSYDARNWDPLFAAGVVELFDDGVEPIRGVRALKVPGHTEDMCIVLVEGGGEVAAFWADLVPTAAHLPVGWLMSYDLFPVQTMAGKRQWLPRAAAGGWLAVFEHDADFPIGRLREDGPDRWRVEPPDG